MEEKIVGKEEINGNNNLRMNGLNLNPLKVSQEQSLEFLLLRLLTEEIY